MLDIIKIGNPILKRKSIDVDLTLDLTDLINNMFITLKKVNGFGLSAPQIGENINLFVLIYLGKRYVVINPKITYITDDKISDFESCLSIPNESFAIERYNKIKMEYFDENKEKQYKEFDGFLARIIQHEFDHLNGVLLTDY